MNLAKYHLKQTTCTSFSKAMFGLSRLLIWTLKSQRNKLLWFLKLLLNWWSTKLKKLLMVIYQFYIKNYKRNMKNQWALTKIMMHRIIKIVTKKMSRVNSWFLKIIHFLSNWQNLHKIQSINVKNDWEKQWRQQILQQKTKTNK